MVPNVGPHTQPGITIGFADHTVDRPGKQTPVGQSYRTRLPSGLENHALDVSSWISIGLADNAVDPPGKQTPVGQSYRARLREFCHCGCQPMKAEAKMSETIVITLITIFMAGPEVSLKGSPTVSPMTAA
jgi:hypothetical protein